MSVLYNRQRNIFFPIKQGKKYQFFLAFHEGRLAAVRVLNEEVASLEVANDITREKALESLSATTGKTSAAEKVLAAIATGGDLPNLDSVPLVSVDNPAFPRPGSQKNEEVEEPLPTVGVGLADAKKQLMRPSKPKILVADPEKKPTAKKTSPRAAVEPGFISLQDICKKLGMDPTAARKKLRASGSRAPDGRWAWPQKDVEKITQLLKK